MATAANHPPQRRETVEFPPNLPVTLSLAYSEPRMVSGQYGERAMFSLQDGRVMFLDPDIAGKITELGINVRESFTITRFSSGKKGQPETWEVARTVGQQPNGTFVVPKLPESAPVNGVGFSDKTAPNSPISAPAPPKPPQRAGNAAGATLADEANALVDIYAEVLSRSLAKYEGRIKPDEIQKLVTTAYIQRKTFAA